MRDPRYFFIAPNVNPLVQPFDIFAGPKPPALLKEYGLDKPLLTQYGIYIGRVLHGDLGKSMITQAPVLQEFGALCRIIFIGNFTKPEIEI